MKTSMIVLALAGLLATGSAFAAQTVASPQNDQVAAQNAGQWVPPNGSTVTPKTRAQVYHELVKAEQDGQLSYLDTTLYSHG